MTTAAGAPIGTRDATETAGPRGPALLQDVNFLDELSHFARERIPERVVHAKGAGAFGYFTVTHDTLRPYSAAKVFESVGKRTPMAARFSTVGGESGSADTARDPRGFALKFYTDDGIWDLVGNNTPVFFIRDPILFPSFIHTQKRNPATHLKDNNMVWDFFTLRPETTHQMLILFSDRGTPDGYRYMNGYGSHTYKLVNAAGEPTYVKFHFKTDQGIRNLSAQRADELAGSDPDYAIRDLYNAIARGDHPSWTLKVQLMSVQQAEEYKINPFDVTKVWPQSDFPLQPVGQFTLDRNPNNYFAEVEQIALSPANLVPGIEASPDKMLQGRLFSYSDTQRHRLGPNHLQLPVNCPYRVQPKTYQRDGPMCFTDNGAGSPNYFPNSFGGPVEEERVRKLQPPHAVASAKKCPVVEAHRYSTSDEDNYSQPQQFYNNVLSVEERNRLIENISGHLAGAAVFIQERAVKNLANVNADFSARIAKNLGLKSSANL